MQKVLEFRTVEEFRSHYFPDAVKKEEMERIMKTPGEFGKYLANQLLDIVKKGLK